MKNLLLLLVFIVMACNSNEQDAGEWLIPSEEVFDGGPGKDGIPSVDQPQFDLASEVNTINDNDLIIGILVNGEPKAYPHNILDWHEIVNDELGNEAFALTYCPLTGTGIAWDRNINGSLTTFGVSGKLYNSNLMPYDRSTDSYWSQMRLDCVTGGLLGTNINTIPIIETKWSTWKESYPNSKVLNTNTGFSRNYEQYPYGDYRTNDSNIIFPVSPLDSRLPAKERALVLINGDNKKVYSNKLFSNGKLIQDEINNEPFIVVGSELKNFVVAFKDPGLIDPQFRFDELPVIVEDASGNRVTLTGEVISGPLAGSQLESPVNYMGYFFALGAFYPNVEIYTN